MGELSFVDFRKYANSKLNIIKEETSRQYAELVMRNFGKLKEDVEIEELYHIAKYNDIDEKNINILKKVTYCDELYDYFIHDDRMCVAVNKDGKIVYIGDYFAANLTGGNIMESKGR